MMDDDAFSPVTEPSRPLKLTQDNIDPDELAERSSGNILFSFGLPGAGKTTFQWMMMRYLMNEGPFSTRIHIPEKAHGPDWEGRALIDEWKTQWISGRFPESTRTGNTREIQIETRTTSGRKVATRFSFIEIAGELLKKVLPHGGNVPTLEPSLQTMFGNDALQYTVILMVHPESEENDTLFADFITFLREDYPSVLRRMSLGVVIANPAAALRRLRDHGSSDGRSGFRKFDLVAQESFLNQFCPETAQILDDWPDPRRTLLAPLLIGDITEEGGRARLLAPNYDHIEQIVFWMIGQFAGKEPGPTLLQSFQKRMVWK